MYLVLFHGGVVLVTHGADLHAALPLSVPLAEELLHDAIRPLAVELQGLGGVAQIGAVHHVLQHLQRADRAEGFQHRRLDKGRVRGGWKSLGCCSFMSLFAV